MRSARRPWTALERAWGARPGREGEADARLVDLLERLLLDLVAEADELGEVGVALGALGVVLVAVRAGEEATSERRPGDDARPEQLARLEHLALLLAIDRVVEVLHRDERRELRVSEVAWEGGGRGTRSAAVPDPRFLGAGGTLSRRRKYCAPCSPWRKPASRGTGMRSSSTFRCTALCRS